jgi:hypothetical protein
MGKFFHLRFIVNLRKPVLREGSLAMVIVKRLVLALAMVSMIGFFGGARAQSAIGHTDRLVGIEVSPGIVDADQNIRFGVAFVGQASGALPGLFAASANYSPAAPGPGVTNSVIGGFWAITVIRNGRLAGTLYGHITGGAAVWNSTGTMATVIIELNITGGTKTFLGVTGGGTFNGILDHTPLLRRRPPTITGNLNLTF